MLVKSRLVQSHGRALPQRLMAASAVGRLAWVGLANAVGGVAMWTNDVKGLWHQINSECVEEHMGPIGINSRSGQCPRPACLLQININVRAGGGGHGSALLCQCADTNSGAVVRQIPTEDVLKMAHHIDAMKGILYNKIA
jgi:hypothetical protein